MYRLAPLDRRATVNLTGTYCPTRRDLEERGWFLTSRLSATTARLMALIGGDHEAFLHVKQECRDTRGELADSHLRLREHRLEHGC